MKKNFNDKQHGPECNEAWNEGYRVGRGEVLPGSVTITREDFNSAWARATEKYHSGKVPIYTLICQELFGDRD